VAASGAKIDKPAASGSGSAPAASGYGY